MPMLLIIIFLAVAGYALLWLIGMIVAAWSIWWNTPKRMERKYPGSQSKTIHIYPTHSGSMPPSHDLATAGRARRWYRRLH